MDILNKTPKKNKDIAYRIIDREAIVLSLNDEEKVNIFNETATRIWELIDGKNKVKDIAQKLTKEYQIDYLEAESEVKRLLEEMCFKKLITLN
ncbi:MAG: PqqD family protein [Candidatus Omnitrophica bacterium]|nr:PqqD family protein [Candidatus Omnitrophota bacterium]